MEKKTKILFGYSCTPTYGLTGVDDGGFSIEVDENGKCTYKTYWFPNQGRTTETFDLPKITVEIIKTILKKNEKCIKRIDENLDNKSCDGEFNRFIFAGKEIQALNIENAGQEKKVLQLFYSVAEELKEEGIVLSLQKVKFSDNIKRVKEVAEEDWWNGVEIIGLKK